MGIGIAGGRNFDFQKVSDAKRFVMEVKVTGHLEKKDRNID